MSNNSNNPTNHNGTCIRGHHWVRMPLSAWIVCTKCPAQMRQTDIDSKDPAAAGRRAAKANNE